jgi:DNA-binding ferritin-like protein (Dps family)
MSDANLDLSPSSERFRKRMERMKKHPKEYAAERKERVGDQVEKVREDQERNRDLSDILLFVEEHEEELKDMLGADLENVTGSMQNYDAKQWGEMKQLFGAGQFDLVVEASPQNEPRVSVRIDLPEGNVQEKIPLTPSKQKEILASVQAKKDDV